MGDRRRSFYQLRYKGSGRPVYIEDAGNLLKISGILMQGMDENVLLVSPASNQPLSFTIITPTLDEWCEILRQTDDPVAFEEDSTGTVKAIHRKMERAVGGAVQQRIWHRDGFRCLFCGKSIPQAILTVDHFIPIELGGEDNDGNYLSACRACQKAKGSRDPQEWCDEKGYDYDGLRLYLDGKAPISFIGHLI